MNSEKYIGLDVHQATICVAVMDAKGKVVMESILETKATSILEFLAGLRGTLSVTLEEGTWAAWLYDLLKPHVANLVVCNPRKNALLKHGNKSDKIDARTLASLLRLNDLEPVYHGETGVRMLRELARSYLTIVKDVSRVMNRLKAIYCSLAIPFGGRGLETRDSGEYHYVQGQVRRRKKQVFIRGLNKDHKHDLKGLFKAAATRASVQPGPFQDFSQRSLAKAIQPTMARLTLARKIAAITLTLWKKGENFDAEKLKVQAA